MQEPKILISACLLGEKVKYNGEDNRVEFLAAWAAANPSRFISVCPEAAGGLPIPRPPAERQPDGRVVNVQGADVTMYFLAGAENVLRLAREHNIQIAILKESSPSCGSATIYDGTFSQKKNLRTGCDRCAVAAAWHPRLFGENIDRRAFLFFDYRIFQQSVFK